MIKTLGNPLDVCGNIKVWEKVSSIKNDIDSDLSRNINVNELAAKYDIEVGLLIDRFAEAYGHTPKQYIHELRLSRLPLLISKYNQDLSRQTRTIAREMGFTRRSCLYKFVKSKTGKTWDEYSSCMLSET